MAVDIKGEQHTIGEIFSERYVFAIPPYQRQYAWKEEHAGELLADVQESLGQGEEPVEELDPYFLGSIVLIRRDRQEHEIVDGQQRLITLTILLAVLRELIPEPYRESITHRLYEPVDPRNNISARYRLRPKEHDGDFFRAFIQSEGGMQQLRAQVHVNLSEGQRNMRENAVLYWDELAKLPEDRRLRLAQFVTQRCLLVVISTTALGSAYRIFTVLNDRGVDLTPADILKAEIVGKIPPAEQQEYTARWERIEEALGRDDLSSLFSHVRTIRVKAWRQKSIHEDFRREVMPEVGDGRQLIDRVVVPLGEALFIVRHHCYEHSDEDKAAQVNEQLRWLGEINNNAWVPPALLYLSRYHDRSDRLARFFKELERLAACLMISRTYAHRLEPRYTRLLKAIEAGENLSAPESPIQLTKNEREATLSQLDGNLYQMMATPRNYVLKRLDSYLAERAASYDARVPTVEHVLPQHPRAGSEWMSWFPTAEVRAKWVHRLGNLALLTRQKNDNASNYDFATKKKVYFATSGGTSPYALTTQVLREDVWTPEVVEQRQRMLMDRLRELWRL